MYQFCESVDISQKIEDKIAQTEQKNRRLFTQKEKDIAFEMFMSGFLFCAQYDKGEE